MLLATDSPADAIACVELDVADLERRPEALTELLARRLMAVIVRGVYPPELMTEVVSRLARGADQVPVFRPHTIHRGAVYGWPLVACGAAIDQYLEQAAEFDAACGRLFGEGMRPATRIANVMRGLSGGRPVTVPLAPDGRPYCASTIRYENESFHAPALRPLAAALDCSTLMSFYVQMAHADDGGELRLYHVDCMEGRGGMIGRLGGDAQARPHLEREGYTVLRSGVGDLLLFDGGRIYHEVTTVHGQRWTMGGVFAFSRDQRALHFWG
jgi:hypothetical protein